MNISALNTVIATLFILMVCGFICRKARIIDDAASKKMSELILKIGQPAMIISAISGAEYSNENLKSAGIIVILGFITYAVTALLAFFICKPLKNPDERKITEFSLIFNNCAFIGFPIFEALLPENGLFLASFYIISFNISMWTWGIVILARQRDDIKLTVKKAFLNFGTVPCVIGIFIYLLKAPAIGFELPDVLTKSLGYLSNLCTPISVLITGALIATRSAKQIFASWKLYFFCFVKLIALPLIICLLAKLLRIPDIYALFATAATALPTASTITMFAETYDLDSGYSSLTVGVSSLLSVLTLPLVLMLAQKILGG